MYIPTSVLLNMNTSRSSSKNLFQNVQANSSTTSLASNCSNGGHTIVIREVYEGINSQERFEFELECALEEKAEYIVIEPTKLGKYKYKKLVSFLIKLTKS